MTDRVRQTNMADGEKTFAELDKDFFEKYRKKYDEDYKRNQRLERHYVNRGSKYPPMAIEPMPYERNRISGAGMTDADRALRKQWVMDQRLAPHEPVYVPELTHKNVFRRFYAKPWNVFFKALEPTIVSYSWSSLSALHVFWSVDLDLGVTDSLLATARFQFQTVSALVMTEQYLG